jgi:hypothetical protein
MKPKAAIKRDEMFGNNGKTKQGKTLTEPTDFFNKCDELRDGINWSNQGIKKPSFNQIVFFCVDTIYKNFMAHKEAID